MSIEAVKEFIEKIDDIYAVHIDLNLAFVYYSKEIDKNLKHATEHSKVIFFDGDPRKSETKEKFSMQYKDLKERIRQDGKDTQILNNLCLVSIYQLWEDEYRQMIANELKIAKNDLKSNIFGDIRLVRQAIIHNIKDLKSHFKNLLILTYLQKRETIFFTKEEFDRIIEEIKDSLSKIHGI